jgi:hypothetical protein
MARKKSSSTTNTSHVKPRHQAGLLGPKTRLNPLEPTEMVTADLALPERFVKVNSALIRSRQRDRAALVTKPGSKGSPNRGRARSSRNDGQYRSGSEFVRAQPTQMPTKEVVQAASKLGLKVTPNLVRIVRFKMRQEGSTPSGAPRSRVQATRRPDTPTTSRPAPPSRAAELQFRRLVVELGTARARALVSELQETTKALISA